MHIGQAVVLPEERFLRSLLSIKNSNATGNLYYLQGSAVMRPIGDLDPPPDRRRIVLFEGPQYHSILLARELEEEERARAVSALLRTICQAHRLLQNYEPMSIQGIFIDEKPAVCDDERIREIVGKLACGRLGCDRTAAEKREDAAAVRGIDGKIANAHRHAELCLICKHMLDYYADLRMGRVIRVREPISKFFTPLFARTGQA